MGILFSLFIIKASKDLNTHQLHIMGDRQPPPYECGIETKAWQNILF